MEESLIDIADLAVDRSIRLCASYAEARVHAVRALSASIRNGVLDPPDLTESQGIAVRILSRRGVLIFGATNSVSRESILALVEKMCINPDKLRPIARRSGLSSEDPVIASWRADEIKRVEDIGVDALQRELRDLDSITAESKLANRWLAMETSVEEKYFVSSEGTRISSRVPRLLVLALLTASSNGRTVQRTVEIGGSGGWELLDKLRVREKIVAESEKLVEIAEKAVSRNISDIRRVIVGPEISGIMAHESVGHPFEADRILGREAAQAGESYLSPNSMGRELGGEEAFVSDDPTIPYSYGFYLYDDEGVKARRKRLLLAGKVNEFLHSRETAYLLGTKSNGSSRASSYSREPIPRMSNTFVEPGDYRFEELLEEAGEAVYIRSFMEWNIDDRRENQRYVGLEAYLVKNGELKELLFNPVLEVTSSKLWRSIRARSRDLEFSAATCGKGEPMQGVPVWTGGPHMLLEDIVLRRR